MIYIKDFQVIKNTNATKVRFVFLNFLIIFQFHYSTWLAVDFDTICIPYNHCSFVAGECGMKSSVLTPSCQPFIVLNLPDTWS
jgi:hypothetical protein